MSFVVAYLQISLFLALACFVVLRTTNKASTGAGTRAAAVVLAALAWPVVLIGLAQLLVIVTAQKSPMATRRRGERLEPLQSGR